MELLKTFSSFIKTTLTDKIRDIPIFWSSKKPGPNFFVVGINADLNSDDCTEDVLKKVFLKLSQNSRETPVSGSLFQKVAALQFKVTENCYFYIDTTRDTK